MLNAGDFKNARVLITGGLGFIGSNLAIRLASTGAKVTLVDSLIPEYGGNLFNIHGHEDRLAVNISDVRDPHSMRHLVRGQDFLFNLAGQTSHMDSMENPEADMEINCRAQLSILEACRRNNPGIRIVFASTRQVYGRPRYLPVNEDHPLQPVDVNGINKLAGEWYHTLYSTVYAMNACVLRLTNTIGPRMRVKDARQTFLGIWVKLLLQGKPFEVWGGDQLRDFTFVQDAVDALLQVAGSDAARGQVYNLGGKETVSLGDLAQTLVHAHGCGDYVIREFPTERKAIDIGSYYSDFSRIREAVGWEPKTDLETGLRDTLAYYQEFLQRYL